MEKGTDHTFINLKNKEYLQTLQHQGKLLHTDQLWPRAEQGQQVLEQLSPCLHSRRCSLLEI